MQMQCIKCGETKPFDAFPAMKSGNRRKECRACYNASRRQKRALRSRRPPRVERICPQCGRVTLKHLYQVRERNFCSFDCRVAWQRSQPGRPCLVDGDIARIPLHKRDGSLKAYAIIDTADAEWASQWMWCFTRYVARRHVLEDGTVVHAYLHRELLGLSREDPLRGDHINRNTLDNRRENLRAVTNAGNAQNKTSWKRSSSKYRGVYFKQGKWHARINPNRHTIHLGTFDDEDEAAEAAREARLRLMPYAVD